MMTDREVAENAAKNPQTEWAEFHRRFDAPRVVGLLDEIDELKQTLEVVRSQRDTADKVRSSAFRAHQIRTALKGRW